MYVYRILWLARLLHNFDKLWKIQRWMCRSYFSAKSSFFFNSSTYLKLGVCFFSHFSWYRSKYTFLQTNTGKCFLSYHSLIKLQIIWTLKRIWQVVGKWFIFIRFFSRRVPGLCYLLDLPHAICYTACYLLLEVYSYIYWLI